MVWLDGHPRVCRRGDTTTKPRAATDKSLCSPLITDFYTARATLTVRSVGDRLAILEKHAMRLRGFEAELSAELRDLPSSEDKPSEPAASGVRKFSSIFTLQARSSCS